MTIPRRGLYAIADVATLAKIGLDPLVFADAVLSARPAFLQLRAKDVSSRETLALLRRIAPHARARGVLFFANDRPDLAFLAGCDGVHVGQDDFTVDEARRAAPGLLVGISTHDRAQFEAARAASPDYIAFGPVFPTRSKANPDPVVGVDALRAVVAASSIPVVAIGGIDERTARDVAAAGAIGAVIGALSSSDVREVAAKAARLVEALA